MTKMKCCRECPEYDVCEEKKGCCDMCDFYNPKTKKCAYIKKNKKSSKDLKRKKLEEELEEDLEPPEEEGIEKLEEEYDDKDPLDYDEEMDDFFNT